MNAIILAGGKGTRMQSFSALPKVLLPIGGNSILDGSIEKLLNFGVTTIYVTLSYKSELVSKELNKYKKRARIIEVFDDIGTKGNAPGILKALGLSNSTTLICYGDTVFDFPINNMVAYHKEKGVLLTVLCRKTDHPEDSDLVWRENSFIRGSKYPHSFSDFSNKFGVSAFYVIEPKFIAHKISSETNCDWFTFLLEQISSDISYIELYELKSGFIKDLGTPSRYEKFLKNDVNE